MTDHQQSSETTEVGMSLRTRRPLKVGINLPNTVASIEWFAEVLDLLDRGEAEFQ